MEQLDKSKIRDSTRMQIYMSQEQVVKHWNEGNRVQVEVICLWSDLISKIMGNEYMNP